MPDVNTRRSDGQQRRTYHSPLREESARRTRGAVVAAASTLFEQRGFGGTSLAAVAQAAGVARPTVVSAFGSKAALLRVVLDHALSGDDEPVAVADRPWFRPVWDATTPAAVLSRYAGVCTLIGARSWRMFEVVRRAADASPEAASMWESLKANRRAGAQMVARHARSRGPFRPGLTFEQAVDRLWLLNDPAHYGSLVHECGWDEETFRRWLGGQMRTAVLP